MAVFRYIHRWEKEKSPLVFYTLPMIHVGLKSFYDEVAGLLNGMNHVLLEGVPVGIDSELGSYRRMARLLGLCAQSDCLNIELDIRRIYIDMDGEIFKQGIARLTMWEKIKIRYRLLAFYLITLRKKKMVLDYLKAVLAYPETAAARLIDPANHYEYKHNKSPFDLLISNERNEYIAAHLTDYIRDNEAREYRLDTGIVFGDAHMPAIYKVLEAAKYKWRLIQKITVL